MEEKKRQSNEQLVMLLADIAKTKEVKGLTKDITSQLLQSWANGHWFKRKAATIAESKVSSWVAGDRSQAEAGSIENLFENEDTLKQMTALLPSLVSGVVDLFSSYLSQLQKQPGDIKVDLIQNLLTGLLSETTGRAFNSITTLAASLENHEKEAITRGLTQGFSDWLRAVDFGEIKEWLNASKGDVETLTESFNNTLWNYPAKLVILLSFIPQLLNSIATILKIVLGGFNQAPPDLVTDIIHSLLKEISADATSGLMDESVELLQKIVTGSALIGEPGSPFLSEKLADLLSDIDQHSDPEKRNKSLMGWLKEKQIIANRLHDQLTESPDRLKADLTYQVNKLNLRISGFNHRLSNFDDLPEAEFQDSIANSLSELDKQELAEMIGISIRTLTRVVETNPELLSDTVRQIAQQLDTYEISDLIRTISNASNDELSPLARALVPKLVIGICDVLTPADDEFEEEAAAARKALRTLLTTEEAAA